MANCKACGAWFSSSDPGELCPGCERALKRLNGYAVPVVHGRWIGGYQCKDGQRYYEKPWCSVCRSKHEGKTPYCTNCGAKMDLEGCNEQTEI